MPVQAITVQRLDPLVFADWEQRVAKFPEATFFHTAPWARVLSDAYGFRPKYLVTQDDHGEFAAILPFMEVNSWLTGRRGISLPFTDECAGLHRTDFALRAALTAMRDEAERRQWKYWELRGGAAELGMPPSVEFYGHELLLTGTPSQLFARCEKAARNAVHKAERTALRITSTHGVTEIDAFHRLLCQTRARHGVPPQPLLFFRTIREHILSRGHGTLVLAWLGARAVAGAMFFHFGRRALFKFGASDQHHHLLRPNNLVMWHAIQRLAADGYETLDFGRTSLTNPGLRRYKLAWGTTERRIQYVRHDCRRHQYIAVRDASDGWHTHLFKIVPGVLARLLGAAAYKHVA